MTESKASKIDRVQANLPLPEDPPVASDWNSADQRKTGSGQGGAVSSKLGTSEGSSAGLREPASTGPENVDMSTIGRERVEKSSK
ncbi:hypothetical protein QBC35DRAFT_375758 [Podospora australis]|uniref:Uncharacterized protein n=1 Tax=Podospora australis TaxID=1536484 RepID=A0AAN6X4Z7_9PEZI|nr:hypothetical protein QBC35DRAFT_375758 [Podospora australis]